MTDINPDPKTPNPKTKDGPRQAAENESTRHNAVHGGPKDVKKDSASAWGGGSASSPDQPCLAAKRRRLICKVIYGTIH